MYKEREEHQEVTPFDMTMGVFYVYKTVAFLNCETLKGVSFLFNGYVAFMVLLLQGALGFLVVER